MSSPGLTATIGDSRTLMGNSFKRLPELVSKDNFVVVTDKKVGDLYKDQLADFRFIKIGTGERSKTLRTVEGIYEYFLEQKVDRTSYVVGLGGGLVTDVTGFAASTYMRGIRFGFVPTTLLSQVDASLGGKNGVNLRGLKNMIGIIKQPEFCLIDFNFLNTLPREQIISGMAEVVKCGAISDKNLFEYVEINCEEILDLNESKLEHVVSSAIAVKMNVVRQDEMEKGERMKLNFGHTLGHAIEKVTGIPHGYAVSVGMVAASRLSNAKGLLGRDELDRIEELLKRIGLPTRIDADVEEVFGAMSSDKKGAGDSVNMILLNGIGSSAIVRIQKEDLRKSIEGVCT